MGAFKPDNHNTCTYLHSTQQHPVLPSRSKFTATQSSTLAQSCTAQRCIMYHSTSAVRLFAAKAKNEVTKRGHRHGRTTGSNMKKACDTSSTPATAGVVYGASKAHAGLAPPGRLCLALLRVLVLTCSLQPLQQSEGRVRDACSMSQTWATLCNTARFVIYSWFTSKCSKGIPGSTCGSLPLTGAVAVRRPGERT
jgi:hypothetical protein